MKEAFCRPDAIHWCTECCLPSCPLFGDTGDGKIGCSGHNGKIWEGMTERPICLNLDCLDGFSDEDRKTIKQAISKLPAGRLEISEVLAQFKFGRRICSCCNKVLGKKLGISGDSHTYCDACVEVELSKIPEQ